MPSPMQQALLMASVAGTGLPCTPLVPTYISASGGTSSGHSFTFALAPIATALGDYVLVGVTVEDTVATSVTNVTVGGVAMTQWSPGNVTGVGTENIALSFFYGAPGAFTTANIVATTTGSGSEKPTIYVWRLGGIDLGSISTVTSPFATGTSATIGPLQVYSGGVTVGMTLTNMAALTSETWSGVETVTEDFDLLTVSTFARAAGFRISPTSSRSTDSFTATFSVSRNHIGGAISFGACGVTYDPNFSNVVLLMGFEGANGSTGAPGFTDESPSAHGTATVTFDAAIDTSKFEAGASSGKFTIASSGKSLATFPASGDWNFGSAPFTIEFFLNPNSISGTGGFMPIIRGPNANWYLSFTSTHWTFFATDGASPITLTGDQPSINFWYYCCIDFDGTKYRLYDNVGPSGGGSLPQATAAMTASSTSVITISSASAILQLGSGTSSLGNNTFDGWLDELRITKGVARYHSDAGFAVPAVPFPRHA